MLYIILEIIWPSVAHSFVAFNLKHTGLEVSMMKHTVLVEIFFYSFLALKLITQSGESKKVTVKKTKFVKNKK